MTTPSFLDRLKHDPAAGAWMDQTRRYMMIRPDALMGIFARLPVDARHDALAALQASIYTQGGDSARAYRSMGGTGADLLATIVTTAPMLGWGCWTSEDTPGRVVVEVRNSPFAAGFGTSQTPVCHAIAGMLHAVSELMFERPTRAVETCCAATGAHTCRFEAHPFEGSGPGTT